MICKRIFDIVFSLTGILLLSPFFIIISILIMPDSKGEIFYKQIRIGKNQKKFFLLKFRTMRPGSDIKGLITVGGRDPRVTNAGQFLRKYKLDELPQLFNILIGDMSFVGPRPEVEKYVKLYNDEQLKVLSIKPGLTDYASLAYINESEILGQSQDPEKTYTEEIMPAKLKLNLEYIKDQCFITDMKIIGKTFGRIFS